MRRTHRFAGVKADPATLKSLPQFQPEVGFNIEGIDSETGEYRAFTPDQQAGLSKILANAVQSYLKHFDIKEREQRLKRFVKGALSAIATYEHQRAEQDNFDRVAARANIIEAHSALLAAHRALLSIAMNRRLMRFLEQLFAHRKPKTASPETSSSKRRDDAKSLANQIEHSERLLSGYRAFNPSSVAEQLSRLEPVLMLAAERLLLQPGDMQRDDVAATFTDMMAAAWRETTEKFPTYAKPSPRSRSPSPFAALLTSINRQFLKSEFRSKNDFRDFAVASIKKLRRDFPGSC
jgi:hypothetical protein